MGDCTLYPLADCPSVVVTMCWISELAWASSSGSHEESLTRPGSGFGVGAYQTIAKPSSVPVERILITPSAAALYPAIPLLSTR